MKKANYILIGILFITTGFIGILNCRADNYVMSLKEDDELIMTIRTLNRDNLAQTFGFDNTDDDDGTYEPPYWYMKAGMKQKFQVTSIEEEKVPNYGNSDIFIVTFDVWHFEDNGKFFEKPDIEGDANNFTDTTDDQGFVYYFFKDSEDLNDYTNNSVTLTSALYCPTPVPSYLEDLEWQDKENYTYSSEGNTITFEGLLGEVDENGNEVKGYRKWIYGNDGILDKYQLLNEDEEILYETTIGGAGFIPGYPISALLGVFTSFSIAIIFFVYNKKEVI